MTRYRYQIAFIITAIFLVLLAYIAILKTLDGLIVNYGMWVSAGMGADNTNGLAEKQERLTSQLAEKRAIFDSIKSRRVFTQTSLQELAQENDCRLIQLDSRNSLQDKSLVYDVSYAGAFSSVTDLIYALETEFLIRVQTIILVTGNQSGTTIKAKVTLIVEEYGL